MSVGDPIKLGSANAGTLTAEPGWEIVTNDFGTDVVTVTYNASSYNNAQAFRPTRGDDYSGNISCLTGFKCDSSTVIGGQGATGRLRVIYMRPCINFRAILSVGTTLRGLTDLGLGTANFLTIGEPTVARRYASFTGNEFALSTTLTATQSNTLGFPSLSGNTNQSLNAFGSRHTYRYDNSWLLIGLEFEPRCNKYFYEVKETWRAAYTYLGSTLNG